VISGPVPPSAAIGRDGDFYIDTVAHFVYGPKAFGTWPPGVSMIGPTGPTGPTGAAGVAGAAGASEYGGMRFSFSSSTTTNVDPGVGIVRFNNAAFASVTQIAIDDKSIDAGNPDISAYILSFDDSTNPQKGYLVIGQPTTPGSFLIFSIASLVDQVGYTQINGNRVASNGSFTTG
jgi:hypothetical protein